MKGQGRVARSGALQDERNYLQGRREDGLEGCVWEKKKIFFFGMKRTI